MSISWTRPSMTLWSAGPPMAVRFAVVTVLARISAVFQGVMRNSWKLVASPLPARTVAIRWYRSL
jgi:hypothetical protein